MYWQVLQHRTHIYTAAALPSSIKSNLYYLRRIVVAITAVHTLARLNNTKKQLQRKSYNKVAEAIYFIKLYSVEIICPFPVHALVSLNKDEMIELSHETFLVSNMIQDIIYI
jgi:hypothetical protein